MNPLKWWLRVVGSLYLFLFVAAAFLKLPIQAEGPPGLLLRAAEGDSTARFAVDTWVALGIWFAVLGLALLIASRRPQAATALVLTAIGWEFGGMAIDVYKLYRGYALAPPVIWMVIHLVIITSGLLIFRSGKSSSAAANIR